MKSNIILICKETVFMNGDLEAYLNKLLFILILYTTILDRIVLYR